MTAPQKASAAANSTSQRPSATKLGLAFGALGVVYGDIGTSPLYAVKECFQGHSPVPVNETNVLGVLSLIFWSLTVVVSVKYLSFIMRANNRGEGGIFALLAVLPGTGSGLRSSRHATLVLCALFGAALLYGDGVITPAVSVLSAVEGLQIAAPGLESVVVPLTCVILFAVFAAQRFGTAGVARVFSPIMAAWFVTISVTGAISVAQNLEVLSAVNPVHAVRFFIENRAQGFLVLGSVVLCITGGEALYADMGHFGWKPIRFSWYAMVLPSLLLNYFGQGALLLRSPEAAPNPFFYLVPEGLLIPLAILSTSAAVIASQALISGAFSLTRSAVQLGFMPRLRIIHTSGTTEGQIYIPSVNNALMVACIGLVIAFRSSTNLAGAYGVAVTAVMGITSILFYYVAHYNWGWPKARILPLVLLFLFFDLGYLAANLAKFFEGGWFPIAAALLVLAVFTTWKRGREMLAVRIVRTALPIELLIDDVKNGSILRVPGTAVFMASNLTGTPPVLLHHVKHNKVLHKQVVLLSIQSVDVPTVATEERLNLEALDAGFYRVVGKYGFMETPNVPTLMALAARRGLHAHVSETSYYLGRETLLATGSAPMPSWRKRLFALLSRNAQSPTSFFGLPPNRVIEIGMQVEL